MEKKDGPFWFGEKSNRGEYLVSILSSFVDDSIGEGFIASLAQPGGNSTGQALRSGEQSAKRLELLHEAVPMARRFAVLSARTPGNECQANEVADMGQRLGPTVIAVRAKDSTEYGQAFAALRATDAEALNVLLTRFSLVTPRRSRAWPLRRACQRHAYGPSWRTTAV